MVQNTDPEKTPILLFPIRRVELFETGRELFNKENFFEAHEAWEELWKLENGSDRVFVQALIQVAGHLVHLAKGNWSGAQSLANLAHDKFKTSPIHKLYRSLDVAPLLAALEYNLQILEEMRREGPPPVPEAFLTPKLFEK